MRTQGLDAREAAIASMHEVAPALVAIILVLCAVFVPVAFLGGIAGRLYQQFAVTIAVAVVISGVVALTLTPAMCAVLLKHTEPKRRGFFGWFNRQVDRVTTGFGHAVVLVIKRMILAFILLALMLGVGVGVLGAVRPNSWADHLTSRWRKS